MGADGTQVENIEQQAEYDPCKITSHFRVDSNLPIDEAKSRYGTHEMPSKNRNRRQREERDYAINNKDLYVIEKLQTYRIIRENMIYAIGLPSQLADEDLLKKDEYFGQYGKVKRIVINMAPKGYSNG